MIPSYPASIVCLRAKHAFRPKYAFGEKIKGKAAGRPHMRAEHDTLISCEHSLLAGEACFQTKVCIRRENSCRQDMPPFLRAPRGGRVGVGGGLKRKLELRPKRHALIFGGIPSFLVILIDPKRQPFSLHLAPPSSSGSGQLA